MKASIKSTFYEDEVNKTNWFTDGSVLAVRWIAISQHLEKNEMYDSRRA